MERLIIDKDHFYSMEGRNFSVLCKNVVDACERISLEFDIDKQIVFRMLYSMFLADGSTMYSIVYNVFGEFCDETYSNLSTLTIENDLARIIKEFNSHY